MYGSPVWYGSPESEDWWEIGFVINVEVVYGSPVWYGSPESEDWWEIGFVIDVEVVYGSPVWYGSPESEDWWEIGFVINVEVVYGSPQIHKVSGNEFFLNFIFTEMSHRDILKSVTIFGKIDCGLRRLVEFFEADIYDVEFLGATFGTIRSSPKKIFRSYSGFRLFFGILFLARNSKTAHF